MAHQKVFIYHIGSVTLSGFCRIIPQMGNIFILTNLNQNFLKHFHNQVLSCSYVAFICRVHAYNSAKASQQNGLKYDI